MFSMRSHLFTVVTVFTAVLYGYPPKEVPSYDPTTTLESLQLKSGETIIVDETDKPRLRTVAPDQNSVLAPGPPLDGGISVSVTSSRTEPSYVTSGEDVVRVGSQAAMDSVGGTQSGFGGAGSRVQGKLARK